MDSNLILMRPEASEQIKIFKEHVTNIQFSTSEYAYLISMKWLQKWYKSVGYYNNSEPTNDCPPIDNKDLVSEKGENRRVLMEGIHHFVVKKDMWDLLVKWYGGGPEIKVEVGFDPIRKQNVPDVHPLTIHIFYSFQTIKKYLIHNNRDNQNANSGHDINYITLQYSKYKTADMLRNSICEKLQISPSRLSLFMLTSINEKIDANSANKNRTNDVLRKVNRKKLEGARTLSEYHISNNQQLILDIENDHSRNIGMHKSNPEEHHQMQIEINTQPNSFGNSKAGIPKANPINFNSSGSHSKKKSHLDSNGSPNNSSSFNQNTNSNSNSNSNYNEIDPNIKMDETNKSSLPSSASMMFVKGSKTTFTLPTSTSMSFVQSSILKGDHNENENEGNNNNNDNNEDNKVSTFNLNDDNSSDSNSEIIHRYSGSRNRLADLEASGNPNASNFNTFAGYNRINQSKNLKNSAYLMHGPSQQIGICGLVNLGNTCFFNSSLQVLIHTMPLVNHFLNDHWKSEMSLTNKLGTKCACVTAFSSIVERVWAGLATSITPRHLFGVIQRYAPHFSGYAQQDAHELLLFLLDMIHEDLNRVKAREEIKEREELKLKQLKENAAKSPHKSPKKLHKSHKHLHKKKNETDKKDHSNSDSNDGKNSEPKKNKHINKHKKQNEENENEENSDKEQTASKKGSKKHKQEAKSSNSESLNDEQEEEKKSKPKSKKNPKPKEQESSSSDKEPKNEEHQEASAIRDTEKGSDSGEDNKTEKSSTKKKEHKKKEHDNNNKETSEFSKTENNSDSNEKTKAASKKKEHKKKSQNSSEHENNEKSSESENVKATAKKKEHKKKDHEKTVSHKAERSSESDDTKSSTENKEKDQTPNKKKDRKKKNAKSDDEENAKSSDSEEKEKASNKKKEHKKKEHKSNDQESKIGCESEPQTTTKKKAKKKDEDDDRKESSQESSDSASEQKNENNDTNEDIEGYNGNDDAYSQKAWNLYKSHNDSIVVDTFHGLLRSKIRCPNCKSSAVMFDPFVSISLPITRHNQLYQICFVPYDAKLSQRNITLPIPFSSKKDVFEASLFTEIGRTCRVVYAQVSEAIAVNDASNFNTHGGNEKTIPKSHSMSALSLSNEFMTQANNNNSKFISYSLHYNSVEVIAEPSPPVKSTKTYVLEVPDEISYCAIARLAVKVKGMVNSTVKNLNDLYIVEIPSENPSKEEITSACRKRFAYLWNNRTEKEVKKDVHKKMKNESFIKEFRTCRQLQNILKGKEIASFKKGDQCIKVKTNSYGHKFPRFKSNPIISSSVASVIINGKFMDEASGFNYQLLFRPNSESPRLSPLPLPHKNVNVDYSNKKKQTLEGLLKMFTSPTLLDEDNKWYCPKCKEFVCADKKLDIWSMPKCFIVNFKRFAARRNNRGYKKIETNIEFDEIVDFSPFVVGQQTRSHNIKKDAKINENIANDGHNHIEDTINDESDNIEIDQNGNKKMLLYKLYAVVHHNGQLNGGHYTAHSYVESQNKWFFFNDTVVKESTQQAVHQSSAYILFYQRIDDDDNNDVEENKK